MAYSTSQNVSELTLGQQQMLSQGTFHSYFCTGQSMAHIWAHHGCHCAAKLRFLGPKEEIQNLIHTTVTDFDSNLRHLQIVNGQKESHMRKRTVVKKLKKTVGMSEGKECKYVVVQGIRSWRGEAHLQYNIITAYPASKPICERTYPDIVYIY